MRGKTVHVVPVKQIPRAVRMIFAAQKTLQDDQRRDQRQRGNEPPRRYFDFHLLPRRIRFPVPPRQQQSRQDQNRRRVEIEIGMGMDSHRAQSAENRQDHDGPAVRPTAATQETRHPHKRQSQKNIKQDGRGNPHLGKKLQRVVMGHEPAGKNFLRQAVLRIEKKIRTDPRAERKMIADHGRRRLPDIKPFRHKAAGIRLCHGQPPQRDLVGCVVDPGQRHDDDRAQNDERKAAPVLQQHAARRQ